MKIARIIVLIFLLVFAASAGTALYWLYGEDDVLDIHNSPVPVRPLVQKTDDIVFLVVNYCKLREATGVVRRTLVSSTVRIVLPLQTDTGPATCQQVDAPLLIPKGIVPDTYHVHFNIEYQTNPLRKVVEEFDSQDFRIE